MDLRTRIITGVKIMYFVRAPRFRAPRGARRGKVVYLSGVVIGKRCLSGRDKTYWSAAGAPRRGRRHQSYRDRRIRRHRIKSGFLHSRGVSTYR